MPTVVILVLSVIGGANATYLAVHNTRTIISAAKSVQRHTTKPLYVHALKPAAKAVTAPARQLSK